MGLSDREREFWPKISGFASARGAPRALCLTLTPLPFWGVIAAIVIFIPLALILAFFVHRQAIVLQGGDLVVYQLGVWTARVQGEPIVLPLQGGSVRRDGGRLLIGESTYHLQPGWEEAADRIETLSASG